MKNLVQISNNQLTTTSLKIAEIFGRQHKHILENIQHLDIPADFNQPNFRPVKYIDKKGEERKMYEITRDGFTLLAMGFTGKKAMKFKIDFINAFNAMEAELMNHAALKKPTFAETLLSSYHLSTNSVAGGCAAIDIKRQGFEYDRELLITALRLGWSVGVAKTFFHLDRRADYGVPAVIFVY